MQTTGSQEPTRFRVGDLELDVGLQRVARDGVDLLLPKLSFDLLLALVRAAPNLVPNDRLLTLVWPGLVVTDKTVSQRIKLLRDALGDSPEAPRYIGGLRGRGYRVVAPVTVAADADGRARAEPAAAPSTPAVPSTAIAPPSRYRLAWLTIAPAIALLAAALFFSQPGLKPESAPDSAPSSGSEAPTLVILPFREGLRQDELFGSGMAEAVRERLSTLPGIDTIAPESSNRSADGGRTGEEAAERVGARFLLQGSAERAGDTLHVSVQLIDADTDAPLWAEDFARPVGAIFDIQEEIAGRVADAFHQLGITAEPDASPPRLPSTSNVDAYLAYLRGRALVGRWTIASAAEAQKEFTKAIELDPGFAAAYAALYDARLLAADRAAGGASPSAADVYLGGSPLAAVRAQNRHLVDRAIALDPEGGAAYFARAIWAAEDSAERERDFVRGLELDPGNGRGIVAYSEYLDRVGRPDEAGQMLDRVLRIDPMSPRAHFRHVMRMFPVDPATIEAGMARVLEIDPSYQPALQRYAKYRWIFSGDLALAIPTIERALALDPGNPWLTHTVVAMYLDIGDAEHARGLVAAAESPEISGDLLVALYDGQTLLAGEAAFEDAAFANGRQENWGVYEALRDWALATGEIDRALASLSARTGLTTEAPSLENFRAVPAMSHLLIEAGQSQEARELLRATVQWIDEYHLPNLSTVYALRIKASALLLLGESELALDALDASFRGGDYLQWWYTLERDPLWRPMHGNRRFIDIAARVRRHIDGQAEAIATLRERGLVPARVQAN